MAAINSSCNSLASQTFWNGPLSYLVAKGITTGFFFSPVSYVLQKLGVNLSTEVISTNVTPTGDGSFTCSFSGAGVEGSLFLNDRGQFIPRPSDGVGGIITKDGVTQTISGDGKATVLKSEASGPSCSGTSNYIGNLSSCLFRTFVAGLGSVLMSVTAWLLGVVGLLFDWLVGHTIVTFKTSIYNSVSEGVILGWSVFRDVANIFIIGIFVFVAISIILGLKEYGQKKYVARILVVAVLINFSFLFTEMIIDFSNFTATQLYSAAGFPNVDSTNGLKIGSAGATDGVNPLNGYTTTGIGGHFIALTGVSGITNSYNALSDIARTNNSAWLALVHGLFAATLFLVAALVLLYGSYILLVRAILIIFLLLTASLAFASYIIPYKGFVDKGWTLWWSSLIKIAVLAPLLMLLLLVTTIIADALKKSGGTLAAVASATPSVVSVSALFNYLIILGLLFASFKIANSLSSTIAGFNFPAMISTGAVGIASRFAVAPALRQTAGRFFARQEEGRTTTMKAARATSDKLYGDLGIAEIEKKKASERTEDERMKMREFQKSAAQTSRFARRAATSARRADSRFNVMDRPIPTAIVQATGVSAKLVQTPKSTKSHAGKIKEEAEAQAKVAERIAYTPAELNQARYDKQDSVTRELRGRKELIDAQMKAARIVADSAKQGEDDARKVRDEKLVEMTKGNTDYEKEHALLAKVMTESEPRRDVIGNELKEGLNAAIERHLESVSEEVKNGLREKIGAVDSASELENIRKEIAQNVSDPAQRRTVEQQLAQSQQARESQMRHEEEKIQTAREAITQKGLRDDKVDKTGSDYTAAQNALVAASAPRLAYERLRDESAALAPQNIERRAREAGEQVVTNMLGGAVAAAEQVGRQRESIWKRAFGSVTGDNRVIGEAVRKSFNQKHGRDRRQRINRLARNVAADGEPEVSPTGAPESETPPPTTS